MKLRYEIRDNHNPTWRGTRWTSLDKAKRELAVSVGDAGRWSLVDRETKEILETR